MVQPDLHWSADNHWLSFNQLRELPAGTAETEYYLDSTVFLFDRTRPATEPRAVFGPLVNADLKLDRLDVGELIFAPDSPYMVVRTTDTTVPEGKLFVALVSTLTRQPTGVPTWTPIATAADRITDAQFTGRKAFQSSTRAALPRFEVEEGRLKVNPLADWDKARIEAYFEEHDLPPHPLVAQGYPSIGCAPCTSMVKPGEDPRAGRWRGWDKVECGIHTPITDPDDPANFPAF